MPAPSSASCPQHLDQKRRDLDELQPTPSDGVRRGPLRVSGSGGRAGGVARLPGRREGRPRGGGGRLQRGAPQVGGEGDDAGRAVRRHGRQDLRRHSPRQGRRHLHLRSGSPRRVDRERQHHRAARLLPRQGPQGDLPAAHLGGHELPRHGVWLAAQLQGAGPHLQQEARRHAAQDLDRAGDDGEEAHRQGERALRPGLFLQ